MEEEAVLIPLIVFGAIVAMVWLIMHFRTQKAKAMAGSNLEYRALAEEAVRGQRVLLEEVKAMNGTLREIEKLLREV